MRILIKIMTVAVILAISANCCILAYSQTDTTSSSGTNGSAEAKLTRKIDTIHQRTVMTAPLQMSDIGAAGGVAGLNQNHAVFVNAFANFDYMSIDPSSRAGRLKVPLPSLRCPGAMGTTSPTANCIAVRATTGNSIVGQMLSLVNEDQTTNASELQVGQAIGVLQDSPNSGAWGQNIVVTQGPGTAGVAGTEIDMNRGLNCDSGTDAATTDTCPGATAFWGTGINISGHTGSPGYLLTTSSPNVPLFNVGYMIDGNAVRDTGFLDKSSSHAGFRLYNGHTYGFDCSTANVFNACMAMIDADSFSQGKQGIYWFPKTTVAGGDGQTPDGYITMTSGSLRMAADASGHVSINAASDVDTNVDIGSTYKTHNTYINLHSINSGNAYDAQIESTGGSAEANGGGTLNLTAALISLNGTAKLQGLTKSQILGIYSPFEGEIINDSDDHVPVIYENGHWYPIQLGSALQ